MAHPRWHHILTESQRHALRAVDEWNRSDGSYSDFLTHMHKAWHYLLHAEFHKAGHDYHFRDPKTGKYVLVDGEPKAWDLEYCLKIRFPDCSDPIRLNTTLFVALRNKVEHRYEHCLKVATGGKAQALVMNYESEMVGHFGESYSLADRLRFPISLQALSPQGREQLRATAAKLPRRTRDLVAEFEANIDPNILADQKYDFRVRLVPVVTSRSDADLALSFAKAGELSEDEQLAFDAEGRNGWVLTKNRHVEVANKDHLLPGQVARLVEEQVQFEFKVGREHLEMWRKLGVRPTKDAADPYATDSRYCVYNATFNQYAYTTAWVKRIVSLIGTVEGYVEFFGRAPRMKPS